ncbi:iron uptake porin [Cylindrospermopsis raciborskii CS-506_D]|uniref:Iron uptake porin n=2 Tax=Cylindrospermopsis raciborskii TaxID=77022 RepID=A0A838WMC7_9CYAN|nr:iron uptake porin [Cylindrospermopsis raciborskii]MBA4445721.1 iron uptake porin [Cylindrospermopsis raciborskii CS-506_C]MBA4449957.1 iron uptake porin [Cylindrospermopsis raciborskii CS-506_D]MBA4456567.1 iron uptake porin [Cylindrospermopsis raciborskii CS-506_B]MBA4465925.1 iron uptake porin [Cylindrospermopsis raciborskii CS-506_A]
MQKFLLYLLTSSVVGYAISMSGSALAEDVSKTESSVQVSEPNYISQMTSVSQLSDVQPGDWAFQAIQSLIERYGCVGGYPDGKFRGNRTLTRFEFAAALSACLDRINDLISSATADQVTKQDIANIERLQKQFGPELETFKRRVSTLEAKTTRLEATQFSTTTKLQGQVVAVVSDISANKVNVETRTFTDKNATLGVRTRLELVTSFTGKDTLFTRLQSNNIRNPKLADPTGNQNPIDFKEAGFYFGGGDSTALSVTALSYKFPIGDKTQVIAVANDGAAEDLTTTITSFNGDGAFGALSTFGTRNPIYSQLGASGLGINHEFNKNLTLSLGYLGGDMSTGSSSAASPASGKGLFEGPYGALAQLTVKPSDRVTLGLTYINSYNLPLAAGSNNATTNFLGNSLGNFSSNSYGVQASLGVTPKLRLEGWAGYTKSQLLTGIKGDVDIWNYAVNLAFPDLWKKGNLGGLIVGMQPKVTNASTTLSGLKDKDTSYHLEGFYQFKVNDNITITPGLIWLTAPNHNKQNDSVIIGALRTTFSF